MMKVLQKHVIILLAAISLGASACSCSKSSEAKQEKPSKATVNPSELKDVSLRLKWIYYATFAGCITADELGFFREQGLKVRINPGGFELNSIKLVASGSDDFGLTGADELLLARARGVPLVAVAAIIQRSPVSFISKKELDIKTPKDFEGHTVGRKYGTDVDTQYEYLLKLNHVDRSKIREQPVKFDLRPFLTGQVDVFPGYAMGEPVEARRQGLDINILLATDYGVKSYSNVYFTTEKIIRQDPELVEKLLRAVLKGWEYAFRNKNEAVGYVVARNKILNYGQQLEVIKAYEPFVKPNKNAKIGWMERDTWESARKMLLNLGKIKEGTDLDKVFNLRFLENIYRSQ